MVVLIIRKARLRCRLCDCPRFYEEIIRCDSFHTPRGHVHRSLFISINTSPRPGGNVTDFLRNPLSSVDPLEG